MRINSCAAVLGILGLVFCGGNAEAATRTENFAKSYPLGAGGEVQLRNVNGGVTLEAWDRNEVRVEAEKKARGRDDAAIRKALQEIRIEVSRTAGGLRIETRLPSRKNGFLDWLTGDDVSTSVEYRIRVPRNSPLGIQSVNGGLKLTGTRGRAHLTTTNGGIDVAQVTGNLRLETINGGINVASSAGAVNASSTNGGIEVRLADVPDGSDLSFETINGGITLQLPGDVRATVDAATTNGQVSSDFQVSGDTKSRRRVAGEINGGGGTLRLRTSNGSIHIVEG